MYSYNESVTQTFEIKSAFVVIAAAAQLYDKKGYRDIWIYLKDGHLKFFPVQFDTLREFYVGHYPCFAILHGLSNKSWNRLGRSLARIYFQSK